MSDDIPNSANIPCFQFYPKDWLGSVKVTTLSSKEEGILIRLLSYSWLNGHLPTDMKELKALCKSDVRVKDLTRIIQLFFVDRDQKYVNLRLVKEREHQLNNKRKASESGKLGAEKRWGSHSHPNGGAIETPMAKNSIPTPIPTPTPTPIPKERNIKNRKAAIATHPDDVPYPYWGDEYYLKLSKNQENKLFEDYANENVLGVLKEIREWLVAGETPSAVKARTRPSHYLTAVNWIKRNIERNGPANYVNGGSNEYL